MIERVREGFAVAKHRTVKRSRRKGEARKDLAVIGEPLTTVMLHVHGLTQDDVGVFLRKLREACERTRNGPSNIVFR